MKKFCLVCMVAFALTPLAMVGCGSGTSTEVVKEVPPEEPTMTPEEEAAYAKSMEESMK